MRAGRPGVEEGGGKETAAEEGAVLRFPVRRTREKQADRERKLSEIITEMALRFLKKPDASGGDSFNGALCRGEWIYGRPEFGMEE